MSVSPAVPGVSAAEQFPGRVLQDRAAARLRRSVCPTSAMLYKTSLKKFMISEQINSIRYSLPLLAAWLNLKKKKKLEVPGSMSPVQRKGSTNLKHPTSPGISLFFSKSALLPH